MLRTLVKLVPFPGIFTHTVQQWDKDFFLFSRQYRLLLSTLQMPCSVSVADSLVYLHHQHSASNLFSHVANLAHLKLLCWHTIAKCGFVTHLIIRKTNTGWDIFVFSPLCVSLFTNMSKMSFPSSIEHPTSKEY